MNKEELTGFGFSTNGGKTFTDLGGLPNANCATSLTEGDPSVEAFTVGGPTYFYISSIFIPFNVPENALSVTARKVVGSGATASLANSSGIIELAVCDLSNPASPTCHNGSDGSITGAGAPASPYFVVAPGDVNGCENEGAYPAVDPATGAVYVAYEHNWFSGLFNCGGETTQDVMNYVPFSCLTLSATSSCSGPAATEAVNITSLEAAFIPGYNRFPMNDFPRVAVSGPAGTVSMVWNDTREHGTGDIFLQSFNLGSLSLVQSSPVRINSRNNSGGWLFLPAVRQSGSNGNLNISFYSRSSANTALTDVSAATKVNPRTTIPPTKNYTTVTTGPSDWLSVSSIIVPNFGDYTDNYFVGTTLYVAWSDGRLGFPQPFQDHVSVH